jgi:hypothetical protein
MNEGQQELLTAVRDLTEQLERLNNYLQFGQPTAPRGVLSAEIRETLRAIASGEEPCLFMSESTKVYEA